MDHARRLPQTGHYADVSRCPLLAGTAE